MAKQVQSVVGYCRFSSDKQKDGDSERRQRDKIARHAARKGKQVRKIFVDKGVSGAHGMNRETGVFADMIKDLKPGEGIYIENQDRFGRDETLPWLMALHDTVKRGHTITFIDSDTEVNESNFNDINVLLPNFLTSLLGHQENKKKIERIGETWGKKRKATANGVKLGDIGGGWLDYDPDADTYTANERADIVVHMFETIASFKGGIKGIAKGLNLKKVPTFAKGKQDKGHGWSSTHIKRILTSPSVMGWYVPHTTAKKTARHRDETLPIVKDYFPQVISPELFYKVQNILGANEAKGGPKSNATNLFTGIATCERCGGAMWLHSTPAQGGKYHYDTLFCRKAFLKEGCDSTGKIQVKHVERAVLTILWGMVMPQMSEAHARQDRLNAARAELGQAEQQYDNLLALVAKVGVDDKIDKTIATIRADKDRLTSEIERLEAVASDNPLVNWQRCEPTTENRARLANILKREVKSLTIDVPAKTARLVLNDPNDTFDIRWTYTRANQVKKNQADLGFYLTGAGVENQRVGYLDHLQVWKSNGPIEVMTEDDGTLGVILYKAAG